MTIDLAGKPIAITGASSGIGLETALACARAGMPVALAARREDRLQQARASIEQTGGKAITVRCDVTNPDECANLVEQTIRAFGGIYAVFANAGYGFEAPVLDTTDEQLKDIFETNFYGTLHTIRPAIEPMRRAGAGHILICSSAAAKIGIPHLSAYSATKAAQDHIGRALRIELTGTGIFVSTVHPIGTDTEFSDVVTQRSGPAPRRARTPARFRQPATRVARAVVNCLRRPKGEVWTSLSTRMFFGVTTAFPTLADAILRRHFKRP